MSKISMDKSHLKRVLIYHEMLSSNSELINSFKKIGITNKEIEDWKELLMIIYKNEWYIENDKEFLDTCEEYYQSFLIN
jgi:hypothetical protein